MTTRRGAKVPPNTCTARGLETRWRQAQKTSMLRPPGSPCPHVCQPRATMQQAAGASSSKKLQLCLPCPHVCQPHATMQQAAGASSTKGLQLCLARVQPNPRCQSLPRSPPPTPWAKPPDGPGPSHTPALQEVAQDYPKNPNCARHVVEVAAMPHHRRTALSHISKHRTFAARTKATHRKTATA